METAPPIPATTGRKWKTALRLGVTAAFLWWIFAELDWAEIGRTILNASPIFILLQFFLFYADRLISISRTKTLLAFHGHNYGYMDLFRVDMASYYLSYFLPTSGGDVAKGYFIYRGAKDVDSVVVTVIAERIGGLMSLVVLASGAAFVYSSSLPPGVINAVYAGSALITAGFIAFMSDTVHSTVRDFAAGRFKENKYASAIDRFYTALVEFKEHPALMMKILVISVLLQLGRILQYWVAALVVTDTVPLKYFMFFVPIIHLFTQIPVSIQGVGVREVSLVYLFGEVGVARELVITIIFVYYFAGLVTMLPGAYYFTRHGADIISANGKKTGPAN